MEVFIGARRLLLAACTAVTATAFTAGCGDEVGEGSVAGARDASDAASEADPSSRCGAVPTAIAELASDANLDPTFAVQPPYLFYGAPEGLVRVPLVGGTPTVLWSGPLQGIVGATATDVVFTTQGSSACDCWDYFAVPVTGGRALSLDSEPDYYAIAIDATGDDIYLSQENGTKVIPLASGRPTLLTSATGSTAALSGGHLLLGAAPSVTTGGAEIVSVPLAGGRAANVVTTAAPPTLIPCGDRTCWSEVDATYIGVRGAIFVLEPSGKLRSALSWSDGDATNFLSNVVSDGSDFYWPAGPSFPRHNPSALYRVSLSDGSPVVLVNFTSSKFPGEVAVDDRCVYWSLRDTSGRGHIYGLDKTATGPFSQ